MRVRVDVRVLELVRVDEREGDAVRVNEREREAVRVAETVFVEVRLWVDVRERVAVRDAVEVGVLTDASTNANEPITAGGWGDEDAAHSRTDAHRARGHPT